MLAIWFWLAVSRVACCVAFVANDIGDAALIRADAKIIALRESLR